MIDIATTELICPICEGTKAVPICCTKKMELDKTIFFCNICGKEEELPQCCGSYMIIRERK